MEDPEGPQKWAEDQEDPQEINEFIAEVRFTNAQSENQA